MNLPYATDLLPDWKVRPASRLRRWVAEGTAFGVHTATRPYVRREQAQEQADMMNRNAIEAFWGNVRFMLERAELAATIRRERAARDINQQGNLL